MKRFDVHIDFTVSTVAQVIAEDVDVAKHDAGLITAWTLSDILAGRVTVSRSASGQFTVEDYEVTADPEATREMTPP